MNIHTPDFDRVPSREEAERALGVLRQWAGKSSDDEIARLDSGLRGEISGFREAMDAQFQAVDAKFSEKFDVLHRDIQALSRRMFGTD